MHIDGTDDGRGLRDRPKILVAEDNTHFRRVLLDFLEDDYEVTAVSTGKELYALLCECRRLYAAVVTDVIMPYWCGDESIKLARTFGADVPVIFISGVTPDQGDWDSSEGHLLLKPFSREALLDTIARAVEEHACAQKAHP